MPTKPILLQECHGCPAQPGELHDRECVVPRCMATGQQRLPHLVTEVEHDCGDQVWSGRLPGMRECEELGWWVRLATADDAPLKGWIPCPAGTPGACHDLNRLVATADWNPATGRWEIRGRG